MNRVLGILLLVLVGSLVWIAAPVFFQADVAFGQDLKNVRKMLMDKDRELKFNGLEELKKVPVDDEVIDLLIEAMRECSEEFRGSIIVYIKTIGPKAKEAVPALIKAFNIKSERYLSRALIPEALGSIGPTSPEVIPFLIRVAGDFKEDNLIRHYAIKELGKLDQKTKASGGVLSNIFEKDSEKVLRFSALESLVRIHPQNINNVRNIIHVIKNEVKSFQLSSGVVSSSYRPSPQGLHALIDIGMKDEAFSILKEFLNSDDPEKQHIAVDLFYNSDFKTVKLFYNSDNKMEEIIPRLIELLNANPEDKRAVRVQSIALYILLKVEPTSERVVSLMKEFSENKNSRFNRLALNYFKRRN